MRLDKKTCLYAGVTVFIVYLLIRYWDPLCGLFGTALGAAGPMVVGACIAYVTNILMCFYERYFLPRSKSATVKKLRRPLCMLLAFATVVASIAFVVVSVLPELYRCIAVLVEKLPGALSAGYDWVKANVPLQQYLGGEDSLLPLDSINWRETVTKGANLVISGFGGVMGAAVTVVTSVFSSVVTAFLGIVFAVYLLLGKEKLGSQMRKVMRTYLGKTVEEKTVSVLGVVHQCFRNFIVGQCTEALILGTLCAGGMLIFGMPYAIMIGVLVGALALIPIAGAFIAAAIGAFMIFTVSPVQALLFLVFLIILQEIEGNLIYPRVVGSSIGLPGIWVLAAVTVGGGLMGISGMVISVPLVAAAYKLLRRDVEKRSRTSE